MELLYVNTAPAELNHIRVYAVLAQQRCFDTDGVRRDPVIIVTDRTALMCSEFTERIYFFKSLSFNYQTAYI